MAVDFSQSYSARWRLYRVDTRTWLDAERIDGLASASIVRDLTGDAPEIESGSFEFDAPIGRGFAGGYYRLVMEASQRGSSERVDIATLLCESSGEERERGIARNSIGCRSVLHPAKTTELAVGDFAAKGSDGAKEAARILAAYINAPVSVNGSFTLEEAYVFDPRMKALDAVWKLLDAGNFVITIDGRGYVSIGPMPSQPKLMLNTANMRLLQPAVSVDADISGIPNRFTASEDGISAVVENNDPSSPVSYARRGYWVDDSDDTPTRINGEMLPSYAERKLREASLLKRKVYYTRAYVRDVRPGDIAHGAISQSGLSGDMRIVSQSLECGRGVLVAETAETEEQLWR